MTIPRAHFVFRNKNRIILNPDSRTSSPDEDYEEKLKGDFERKKQRARHLVASMSVSKDDATELLATLGLMPRSYYDQITEFRKRHAVGHTKDNKNARSR